MSGCGHNCVFTGSSAPALQGVSVEVLNGTSARLRWAPTESDGVVGYLIQIDRDASVADNTVADSGTRYMTVHTEEVDVSIYVYDHV